MKTIKEIITNKIEEGLLKEGKELLEKYLECNSWDDEIASMQAIIYTYEGDYSAAINVIKQGIKYNIYNSDLYFTMGNIYELTCKYNRAYLLYEQALKLCKLQGNKEIIVNAIHNLKQEHDVVVKGYSIVILTYNNLEYTKKCIASIKENNGQDPLEIIVIDNNSNDGTVQWLKEQNDIKYILNSENKGFPAGCNQGINIAKSDNDIFLLNNDTIVMPNSIFNLRMALYSEEKIGATGAISNSVPYYQQIEEKFDNMDEYFKFSCSNNITNEDMYEQRLKLIGFAMFIKREALNKVGLLDERFTPGNFEDDDLSLRMLIQGYKLLLCRDSFIYHFGSVSFKKDGQAFNKILKRNSEKFKEIWGFYSEDSLKISEEIILQIDKREHEEFNVLQIGCKASGTLLAIKNKFPKANIIGVETDEKLLDISKYLFETINENIQTEQLSLKEESFDYIILDDEIKSFNDPIEVLKKIKKYLKPEGYILATIKNVAHYSVIQGLINGVWNNSSLINGNNKEIRHFTKMEICELFNILEFDNISIQNIYGYIDKEIKNFINIINGISLIDLKEDYKVYKYLIKAKNRKSNYDKLIQKISFLLRRIEFDIDIEETLEEFFEMYSKKNLNEEIIIELVERDIIDKVFVLNYLSIKCFEYNIIDMIIPLLKRAYEIDNNNLDTNYNLAYVLNYFGEESIALEYLNRLENTNINIEELKSSIRGKINGQ